jgi:hypothetical protein
VPPRGVYLMALLDHDLPSMDRFDGTFTSYASLSSSVRYLGASAFTFSMNAACSFSFRHTPAKLM